jgi:hypothetical protein
MYSTEIEPYVKLDKLNNYKARLDFLLSRIHKDVKELEGMGLTLKIEECECVMNDNWEKKLPL